MPVCPKLPARPQTPTRRRVTGGGRRDRTVFHFCLVVWASTILLPPDRLDAQEKVDPRKGPAWTQPPEDEPDFPLLGEFVGPIRTGENEFRAMGLQVKPVGGGTFEAIGYHGGLPGQQGHQPEPLKMLGRRAGDLVVLSGQPFAVFVRDDHCLVIDSEGQRLGRLDRIVRQSPTLGAKPPRGAIVIFDGSDTDQFTSAKMTEEGLLTEGCEIKPMFQDFNLHLEYRIPYMPAASDQGRGNSGVYLQSRYECQILDSFAEEPLFNGHGSLYRFRKPDLNMSFPPLVWQTYDIAFTAPRWAADGSKIRNARITSWVNGVKIHDDVELEDKTGAGKAEEPLLLPTKLQDHGDPVRFRNIWAVDRGLDSTTPFPVWTEKKRPKAAEDRGGEGKPADAPQDPPSEQDDSEADGVGQDA